jgi:hypothetical protein
MDHQTVINIGFGLASTMLGWWMSNVWNSLKDLQKADRELAEKVASIEVLVAGQYVTREEFNSNLSQVFQKLDRIIDAMNHKADR